jgi:hypothetical protein
MSTDIISDGLAMMRLSHTQAYQTEPFRQWKDSLNTLPFAGTDHTIADDSVPDH